ncbi:tetratricopeptide repeat protein [Acinetobacter indicus]|uniref:tetratricopeptide repeat protein n=1 Tax=Acinetobacter indicus TaxID=756892 RepID=UPI003214AB4D
MKRLPTISSIFLIIITLSTRAQTLPETYVLWEQYYQVEQKDLEQATQLLQQISQKSPRDPKVWKTWAYLEMRKNNNNQALIYIDRTLELTPNDEQLLLQKAYLLNAAQRNPEALEIFKKLQSSSNPETAAKAQQAVLNLNGTISGQTKNTFADIYFSPSFEGRYDTAILPLKLRYGRYWGEENRGQIYGFASINKDTQSTGGARPEIIDQNAVIVGVGTNYRPWEWPLYLYLEIGGSYDLIDLNRDKFRESINFGLTGYQEWYWHDSETSHSPVTQKTQYFAELYGNAASYSREDHNVIGDLRLRTGWNFNRDHLGNIQTYLKLHTINDSNNEFYNNLAELGPGIAWQPADFPVKLRVEQMYGKYVNGAPVSGKRTFDNTRVELTYYWSF